MPSTAPRDIALIAAFNSQGQILLLQRPESAHCGGLWSFPGGKVEARESPLTAARRELIEETGLTGSDWRMLGSHRHVYPEIALDLHLFACRCDPSVKLRCQQSPMWTMPGRLGAVPMPAANQALLGLVMSAAADMGVTAGTEP